MEELIKLYEYTKGILGPTLAVGLAAAWYLFSQRNASKKDSADTSGQIKALETYEKLLENERVAREKAEKRADDFAKERNDAHQELWQLKGQVAAMTAQLAQQTVEMAELRKRLEELSEKVNHAA